jgi:hypothetical protein
VEEEQLHGALRIFAYVAVAGIVVAMLYAAYISMVHWSGIGV